ncbi:ACT domain-containing protein [Paenibacillus sp. N4]|uniref:ACT domain-containing protein n=1 Tax=Paenibacillus vietnamensis TaxID=2590547 RepID=UPI001CD14F4B|nr:ACT domain-containing protein [Paenibacillus vietnamensis]MCA0755261.1 ACT domain-containing protein [Paenibacillus vietnamensis]
MTHRYYVVREDILPEAIMKTIQVKEMLSLGKAATVHEAVERVGLSRSAFYKYKDGVYALNELERERIATISMDLEHRSGVLSKVLSLVAGLEGNVLTMNQTIPLQGYANVVISVDISQLSGELSALVELLRSQEGVRKASVIGQG